MKFGRPDLNTQIVENNEQEVDFLLESFPEDLRGFWESKIDGKSSDEAVSILRRGLEDREIANSGFEISSKIKNPELRENIRQTALQILKRNHSEEFFLGEGDYAKVWKMPFSGKLCVKHLLEPEDEQTENNKNLMTNEVLCLESMDGFSVSGVRTPYAYFRGLNKPPYYLGMETIEGLSFKDIKDNPEKAEEFIKYFKPENKYDMILRLKSFLTQMHEQKRVTHRDIHPGNIMIDRDGNLYIIDFGKALVMEIGESYEDEKNDDLDSVVVSTNQVFEAVLTFFDKNDKV